MGFMCNGECFMIDSEDYEMVSEHTWCHGKRGYPTTHYQGKTTTLHKLLVEYPSGYDVDHISGNMRG